MQRKVFFIVGLLILAFCASASRALGQGTWHAVFLRPAASVDDAVRIIMAGNDGDRSVMKYTTSSQLVARLNQMYPWLGMENRADLVAQLRSARIASCGTGMARFDVVKANGTYVPGARNRLIDVDEKCPFVPDPTHPGREVSLFSLKCGNPTPYLTRMVSVMENPQQYTKTDTVTLYRDRPPVEHGFFIPEDRHGMTAWQKVGLGVVGTLVGYGVYTLWPRSHHVEVNVDIRRSLSAPMSAIR
jgi:hypothetical protein